MYVVFIISFGANNPNAKPRAKSKEDDEVAACSLKLCKTEKKQSLDRGQEGAGVE